MSGKLFNRYGAILNEDVAVLEACLTSVVYNVVDRAGKGGRAMILEIGMHDGGTARGMENFLAAHDVLIDYIGIDPDPGLTRPRHVPAGAKVIIGDSAEVYDQVALGGLDLLWVDGCHCFNHVVLDTLHYAPKVRDGGFICFHDVNPKGQNAVEHQYHGPCTPDFGLAVNKALEAIDFPWLRPFPWGTWELFLEMIPTEVHNCGTRAYRRTS